MATSKDEGEEVGEDQGFYADFLNGTPSETSDAPSQTMNEIIDVYGNGGLNLRARDE